MKRIISTVMMAVTILCHTVNIMAVPADKRPMKIRQANGNSLTIRLLGDEHRALWTTIDGFPLLRNEATGNFEYAILEGQSLSASGVIATEVDQRSNAEKALLATIDRQSAIETIAKEHQRARLKKSGKRNILINDFPTIGEPHSLVILVEFADEQFSSMNDPFFYYHNLLNTVGFTHPNGANGSARDFYRLSSNGLFSPRFDVVGPIRLSKEVAFYGKDNGEEIDVNMGEFLVEACQAADELVDFTQYDENNDGSVDNIYFFYAGYGEADSGLSDVIWPQAGTLSEWGKELELDGMTISSYACSQELSGMSYGMYPNGIGTFVHEFGHVLGLADHYDTSYQSRTQHPGSWDTMASGSYNDNQHHPPLFSAFERAELGWLEYTDIEPVGQTIDVGILAIKNEAYRIVVPETEGNEYFILENRQRVNEFEMTLPGKGLLVWHVDMDEEVWKENAVNCKTNHQHLDIVEADGMATANTLAGDAFPGPNRVTTFDFIAWSGDNLFSFLDVVESDITVRVSLSGQDPQSIDSFSDHTKSSDSMMTSRIYDLQGRRLTTMQKGLNVIINNDGSVEKRLK